MHTVFSDIEALNSGGMKFGVAATRKILDNLGSPDKKLKIIHIAGTNGKGSTAEYITRILVAAGKRTGTFVSPMVEDYFDQFQIDGVPFEESRLVPYFLRAYAAAEMKATGFEVQTAGALSAFAGEGCEYAVVECGMGGKLDATNAIAQKSAAVITSIGLEHTAFLGGTYPEICGHKAGIINNCPAIVNGLQPPEVRQFFADKGVIFADGVKILKSSAKEQEFSYGGSNYKIRMPTLSQAYDAATAIETAKVLKIDENAIRRGLYDAKPAGRLQILKARGNTYIVDGGHNPDGVAPLAELLKEFSSVTLIYASLADKDINGVLARLSGLSVKKVFSIRPPGPRATDLSLQTAVCKKYFTAVEEQANIVNALEKAGGVVAICGTFTIIKEALNWIKNGQ